MFHGFQTPVKKVSYPTLFSFNNWKCWSYSDLPQQKPKPKIKSSYVHIYIWSVRVWNNFAYLNTDSFKFKLVILPIFSVTLEFQAHILLKETIFGRENIFVYKNTSHEYSNSAKYFHPSEGFWKRMTIMHHYALLLFGGALYCFFEEKYTISQTAIYTLGLIIFSVNTANSINTRQQ